MKTYVESLYKFFENIRFPEYSVFSFFAIITGAAAGLAAVLFHNSIDLLNEFFFTENGNQFDFGLLLVILIPAIGMLLQAAMIKTFPKTAKQKGVSEVIKAVALRGGHIPFRTTLFHFIAPVISIGTGATVGPEGPAAQIGGGVGSKLAGIFGLSDSKRRIFTAAGAGAAISAIFNTPLGGIFFALEVVFLNDFQSPTFSALILASVTASAIARIFLGNESLFIFSNTQFSDYSNLYMFALFGLLVGFLSILFIRYSSFIDHICRTKILKIFPQWAVMTLIGLLVGTAGYFYPEIFGIGYQAINEFLAGNLAWQIVLILIVLKFVLVPLILYSGGFGGLFAPSLFIGAGAGFLFAVFMNTTLGFELNPTIFVLVGMGAALGGINTIPISSILIIFEMTKDYGIILPLMLAVVVSTTLVQIVLRGSVHTKHLEEQGYQIANGRETRILRNILVADLKLHDAEFIEESAPLRKIVGKLIQSDISSIYVVDKDNRIIGVISESELRPIIADFDSVKDFIVARDIMNTEIYLCTLEDNLDKLLRQFGKYNLDEFPVVKNNEILGVVTKQDVIDCYDKESLKINLADGLKDELVHLEKTGETELGNYKMVERPVPDKFIGKSLAEIKIRNRYGVEVLLIKRPKEMFSIDTTEYEIIAPRADMRLQRNDVLVIFGEHTKIHNFGK